MRKSQGKRINLRKEELHFLYIWRKGLKFSVSEMKTKNDERHHVGRPYFFQKKRENAIVN